MGFEIDLNFFDFMEPILNELGHALPPRSKSIPYPVMRIIGALLEGVALACRPVVRFVPTLTLSSVRFVAHDHGRPACRCATSGRPAR